MSLEALPVETSPEIELLLACANPYPQPAAARRIETLARQVSNWPRLLTLARQHLVEPLLFWNLNQLCPAVVPPASLARLQQRYRLTVQRNFYRTRELVKLLTLLEAHDLPAIPYKGPMVAASIYPNLGLRQFGDLDIIIRRNDFEAAKQLLLAEGLRQLFVKNQFQEDVYLGSRFHYDYHFFREADELKVELHWRLSPTFPADPERLWQRVQPAALAGLPVRHFCPEDLILYLCMHGAKHRWRYVRLISDVAALIGCQPGLGWEQALEQAQAMGEQRVLRWGLYLAHILLDVPLPPEVWTRVEADSPIRSMSVQTYHRMFFDVEGRPGVIDDLVLKEKLQARLYHFLQLVRWTITPGLSGHKHLKVSKFHFLTRAGRFVRKYGRSYLKSIRHF